MDILTNGTDFLHARIESGCGATGELTACYESEPQSRGERHWWGCFRAGDEVRVRTASGRAPRVRDQFFRPLETQRSPDGEIRFRVPSYGVVHLYLEGSSLAGAAFRLECHRARPSATWRTQPRRWTRRTPLRTAC